METNGILDNVAYTHLLTGYIGSLSFLEAVLDVLSSLRSRNPDLIYVCDPVLGDHGTLYVPEALVECYKTKVIPHASVLTPNQFECELLSGVSIKTRADAIAATNVLHKCGITTIFITSLEYAENQHKSHSSTSATCTVLTVFASHVVRPEEAREEEGGNLHKYELSMPKKKRYKFKTGLK